MNSQRYSSIYEDRRPKIEDIETSDSKKCLRTIRSLGPTGGPGRLKPPAQVQGLLQDSWERARLGCVSSQVLVWTRGASVGRISQKEKEKREALSS